MIEAKIPTHPVSQGLLLCSCFKQQIWGFMKVQQMISCSLNYSWTGNAGKILGTCWILCLLCQKNLAALWVSCIFTWGNTTPVPGNKMSQNGPTVNRRQFNYLRIKACLSPFISIDLDAINSAEDQAVNIEMFLLDEISS